MNISLKNIQERLADMNIKNIHFSKMISVKNSTLNEYLNGSRDIERMSAELYTKVVNKLFTSFEQMILSDINNTMKVFKDKSDEKIYYDVLLKCIKKNNYEVYLSGQRASEDDGTMTQLPQHVEVRVFGAVKYEFNIYDDDLYKELKESGGQANKKQCVLNYLKNKLCIG